MSFPRNTRSRTSIALTLERTAFPLFSALLQHGIRVPAALSCSVQSFLCDQMGLEPNYLGERIQSIVLDGKPVDEPAAATLREGSRLALSSGMPGLAGAALRRGSPLASFRGSITHRDSVVSGERRQGTIRVKLFNLMLGDLGPRFLERGILIESGAFARLLRQNRASFVEKCRGVHRNEIAVEPTALLEELADDEEELLLSVILSPQTP